MIKTYTKKKNNKQGLTEFEWWWLDLEIPFFNEWKKNLRTKYKSKLTVSIKLNIGCQIWSVTGVLSFRVGKFDKFFSMYFFAAVIFDNHLSVIFVTRVFFSLKILSTWFFSSDFCHLGFCQLNFYSVI